MSDGMSDARHEEREWNEFEKVFEALLDKLGDLYDPMFGKLPTVVVEHMDEEFRRRFHLRVGKERIEGEGE